MKDKTQKIDNTSNCADAEASSACIVSLEFLLKQGFKKTGVQDIYSKKIHANIFLEYDWRDDFATLVRFEEIVKHDIDRVKIVIPKKIKTKQDLINLLNVLEG